MNGRVFSSPVAGFSMTHIKGSKCAMISRALQVFNPSWGTLPRVCPRVLQLVHDHLDIHGLLHGLARGAEGPDAVVLVVVEDPARRRHLLHLQLSWWAYRAKAPKAVAALLHVPVLGLLWQQLKNGHVVRRAAVSKP